MSSIVITWFKQNCSVVYVYITCSKITLMHIYRTLEQWFPSFLSPYFAYIKFRFVTRPASKTHIRNSELGMVTQYHFTLSKPSPSQCRIIQRTNRSNRGSQKPAVEEEEEAKELLHSSMHDNIPRPSSLETRRLTVTARQSDRWSRTGEPQAADHRSTSTVDLSSALAAASHSVYAQPMT